MTGRKRIYEGLTRITIGITLEELKKLDGICSKLGLSRHEYLSACLECDSDGTATIEANLKEKTAEVLSLKGKLEQKHRDVEELKGVVAKLKERLSKKESKISKEDAKIQMQIEDLRKKCENRITTCKQNVGNLAYNRGVRDQYHDHVINEIVRAYKLIRIEGGKDEYLERELANCLT